MIRRVILSDPSPAPILLAPRRPLRLDQVEAIRRAWSAAFTGPGSSRPPFLVIEPSLNPHRLEGGRWVPLAGDLVEDLAGDRLDQLDQAEAPDERDDRPPMDPQRLG